MSGDIGVAEESCANTGCASVTSAAANSAERQDATRLKNVGSAELLGLICVLGCAAGPIVIGGLATLTGAVSGKTWIMAAGLITSAAIFVYRRRTGRRGGC